MSFIQNHIGDITAIGSAVTWSSAVILMKYTKSELPAVAFNLFKSLMASILFIVAAFILDGAPPNYEVSQWALIIFSGILGISLGDVFFVLALNKLGASNQAIVDCTYSPLFMIFAFLFLGEMITIPNILGASLVISAVLLLSLKNKGLNISKDDLIRGIIYGIMSKITMIIAVILIRDLLRETSLLWMTAIRFSIATIILFAFTKDKKTKFEFFEFFSDKKLFKLGIIISIIGPFLSTILWMMGFKYIDASKAAIYNQMSTIFIVMLSVFILKEAMNLRKSLAIFLGISGALIVSLF